MKQNPILTIAQNIVRKKLSEDALSRGKTKDAIRDVITFSTPDKLEKTEISIFLRAPDIDNKFNFLPNDLIFRAMDYASKSQTLKSKIEIFSKRDNGGSPIMQILAGTMPFDLNSRYRRMSPRVCEYISSLGAVSKDLSETAIEDLKTLRNPVTGIFHDMILVDTKKGSIIMETFITETRIRIMMRIGSSSSHVSYPIADLPPIAGWEEVDPTVLFNDSNKFDPLSFYVNIYLAEKTNHLVPGKESNYDKKKVIEICRAEKKPYDPKDKSVRYEYIDVSEDRWKQHTEFKNAVYRKMEGDRKWYKSHWWRKAHYMKAGKDKHLAFVEATICHRSCGKIEDEDLQVVQVLR